MKLHASLMGGFEGIDLGSFVDQILLGLTTNLLWVLLGAVALLLSRRLFVIHPMRRLWPVADPAQLLICVSTSVITFTGKYHRRATGLGQLRALSLIVDSLAKAYKTFDFRNIVMSDEQLGNRLERDLILIGGPKNNRIAKHVLGLQGKVELDETGLRWKLDAESSDFSAEIADGKVKRDFGLLIRSANPFARGSDRIFFMVAGIHTFGTIAATRYFVETRRLRWRHWGKSLMLVVSCRVVDDHPVDIRLEKKLSQKGSIWRS